MLIWLAYGKAKAVGMAKLRAQPSRLTAMRPTLVAPKDEAGRSAFRARTHAYRAWYKTARWQKLRWKALVDAAFICAICGKGESDTSRLVADHIIPHRGNPDLFWSKDNLQCLDKSCHDTVKRKEERSGLYD